MTKVITLSNGVKITMDSDWISGYQGSGVLCQDGTVLTTYSRAWGLSKAKIKQLVRDRQGFVPVVSKG